MKQHPTLAFRRSHRFYLVILLALALAAVVLWFADPAHRPTGGSRIPWPTWSQPGH